MGASKFAFQTLSPPPGVERTTLGVMSARKIKHGFYGGWQSAGEPCGPTTQTTHLEYLLVVPVRVEVGQLRRQPVVLPDPQGVHGGDPGVLVHPDVARLEAPPVVVARGGGGGASLATVQTVVVRGEQLVKVVVELDL